MSPPPPLRERETRHASWRVLALLFAVQVSFASLAVVGKVTVGAVPWRSLVLLRTGGAALVFALIGALRREPQLPPRGERWNMMAVTVSQPLARWMGVEVPVEALTARTVAGGLAVLAGVAVATFAGAPRR